MDAARPVIRTPDQRIRVFVSSTLKELAPEREAVRAAIERLQLAPVMFELGARPHPPRDLYRSYLAQSDVFVGIYGERYGWVAPGEEISGLEDEYRMSGDLPALIYVKHPAPEREERLATLLDTIRDDDRTSYKSFAGPEDLADLVTADIATLFAERFEAGARSGDVPTVHPVASEIPAPYTAIVGRDRELGEISAMLSDAHNRIVTIVGPGGVGKSRLAIEVATRLADERDVAFAALEAVATPERAITAIARSLGVRDTGDEPLERKVLAALGDRPVLLVVDNMEHLLDATPTLVDLVTDAPQLQLLVTSRSPLRLRAERVYPLAPLDVPGPDASLDSVRDSAAVRLFLQRATAVRPSFAVTPESLAVVAEICRALDGMPLAIELAAARVRALAPQDILERLDSALTLLVGGARDLPERQRALGRTIEWSVDLLSADARAAFAALAVFAGRFSLEAAEDVLHAAGVPDPLAALEALVDASLLNQTEHAGAPTFRYLALVRTYAGGLLTGDQRERVTAAWIDHYRGAADLAGAELRGDQQLRWLTLLELEVEDLARVERALLDARRLDDAAGFAWSLFLFLWIGGYLGVVRGWMTELVALTENEGLTVAPHSRAVALYYINAIRFWEDLEYDPIPGMRESRRLFDDSGDMFGAALAGVSLGLALLAQRTGPDIESATVALEQSNAVFRSIDDAWGQAMALVMLGRLAMLTGDLPKALSAFEQSLELARTQGEMLGVVIAQNHRGWARFLSGDPAGAHDDFSEGLDRSLILRHDEGIAYGLEGFVGLRARDGDAREAGLLLGAATTLRVRKGILNPGAFEFYTIPVQALRDAGHGADLDQGIADGRSLTLEGALTHVRG